MNAWGEKFDDSSRQISAKPSKQCFQVIIYDRFIIEPAWISRDVIYERSRDDMSELNSGLDSFVYLLNGDARRSRKPFDSKKILSPLVTRYFAIEPWPVVASAKPDGLMNSPWGNFLFCVL
jgi:hypothetical protein